MVRLMGREICIKSIVYVLSKPAVVCSGFLDWLRHCQPVQSDSDRWRYLVETSREKCNFVSTSNC
jgi:hypothetical protein